MTGGMVVVTSGVVDELEEVRAREGGREGV